MFDKAELQQRISNLLASGYGSKEIVELVEEKFIYTNSDMDEICADYKSSAYCTWQPTYMRCGVVPCKRERKLRQ